MSLRFRACLLGQAGVIGRGRESLGSGVWMKGESYPHVAFEEKPFLPEDGKPGLRRVQLFLKEHKQASAVLQSGQDERLESFPKQLALDQNTLPTGGTVPGCPLVLREDTQTMGLCLPGAYCLIGVTLK